MTVRIKVACTCGASTVCALPEPVALGQPGDYVVAPGVAARVKEEVQFNLRHFDPAAGRVVHPLLLDGAP